MNQRLASLLRTTAFLLLTITAIGVGLSIGWGNAVAGCLSWGCVIALAMHSGCRAAPPQNWERDASRIVFAGLIAIAFAPAIISLVFSNFAGSICLAWSIVATMAITFRFCEALFGNIRPNRKQSA